MQIDVAGQLLGMGAQSRVYPGGQANEEAQEEEGWESGLAGSSTARLGVWAGREQHALPRWAQAAAAPPSRSESCWLPLREQ